MAYKKETNPQKVKRTALNINIISKKKSDIQKKIAISIDT